EVQMSDLSWMPGGQEKLKDKGTPFVHAASLIQNAVLEHASPAITPHLAARRDSMRSSIDATAAAGASSPAHSSGKADETSPRERAGSRLRPKPE
ncbi:MAG: hypothetical protein V4490_02735, partial [Pseudomonadota bacterium]